MTPEILHAAFFRNIFDAIPSPLFVVDDAVRIFHVNQAASGILMGDAESVYNKRTGDALHCIHAAASPEGCGRGSLCHTGVIRNAVHEAFRGGKVHRKKALLTVMTSNGQNDQNYWQNLEEYLITHHDIDFSHGVCEECQKKHFPEIDR